MKITRTLQKLLSNLSYEPLDDFLNFESWLKVSVTRFSGNWLLWQFFEYLSNR